eukprot:gene4247-4812_t
MAEQGGGINPGVSGYFEQLSSLVDDIRERGPSKDALELLLERISETLQSLNFVLSNVSSVSARNDLEQVMLNFLTFSQMISRELNGTNGRAYQNLAIYQVTPNIHIEQGAVRCVGRPKYKIDQETLVGFRSFGYTWREIADMLMVSRWTIHRRVKELAIANVTGYSVISESDLDGIISRFQETHGRHTGRSLITGHINALGLRIQQWRLREALARVVPHDGRIRIRTDKGGENVLLWHEMELLRGPGRGSYLAGSSTRNQRIERLWRDVWMYVAHLFYYTFQAMEVEGILDMENDKHKYILHMIFVPRINQVISNFIAEVSLDTTTEIGDQGGESMMQNNFDWYGFDPYAPAPSDDGLSQVDVEDASCPFSIEELGIMRSINVLRVSNTYGIDIFLEACSYIDA